jgi:hypothetical protein
MALYTSCGLFQKDLAEQINVRACLLSKWKAQEVELFDEVHQNPRLRKVRRQDSRKFPGLCDELYMKFYHRRMILGLYTSELWLVINMRKLLARDQPPGWEYAKLSNGWLHGYKKLYRISNQVRTNKKEKPLSERLPEIQKFHRWLIYDLQGTAPQTDSKYGRFAPDNVYHMDQIPLAFVLSARMTLNPMGMACHLIQPKGGGLDKRQATIQLTIRARGEQNVLPAMIMRGQGNTCCLEELEAYNRLRGLIVIYFQPKAWADGYVMLDWLDQFQGSTQGQGERLLGMDNHGAQCTQAFRNKMDSMRIQPAFTPPDCTDVVAPVDHHVGAALKHVMGKLYHAALEANYDEWTTNGLPSWKRRVLMAEWTALAWHTVIKRKTTLLWKAFVSTGFCIAKDGSENHLVRVPMPNGAPYTF